MLTLATCDVLIMTRFAPRIAERAKGRGLLSPSWRPVVFMSQANGAQKSGGGGGGGTDHRVFSLNLNLNL